MTDYRRHLKPGTVILCSQGGVAFNHAALDQLAEALVQAEREREIAESTASNLRTRLKTYSDLVMLRPFKWLAVRGADEAVPIPEPESFAAVVEERDTARAEVERLRVQTTYPDDPARSVAAMLSRMSRKDKQAFNFCVKQVEGSLRADLARVRGALEWVSDRCPCGARAQSSPQSHPHVTGCPVGAALEGRG